MRDSQSSALHFLRSTHNVLPEKVSKFLSQKALLIGSAFRSTVGKIINNTEAERRRICNHIETSIN